jgi:hypothetical protein
MSSSTIDPETTKPRLHEESQLHSVRTAITVMKSPSNYDFAIADGISNFNLQPHRTIDNHDAENEGFEDTLQVSENYSGAIQNRVDTPAYPSNSDKPVVGGTEDVNKQGHDKNTATTWSL